MAPYKEYETVQIYFTIGEVAKEINVATSLLRYWETYFPELHPKKGKRGNRKYRKEDIAIVYKLYYLIKLRGHTLWGAKLILDEEKHEKSNIN